MPTALSTPKPCLLLSPAGLLGAGAPVLEQRAGESCVRPCSRMLPYSRFSLKKDLELTFPYQEGAMGSEVYEEHRKKCKCLEVIKQ